MKSARKKEQFAERLAAAALRGYFRASESSFQDMKTDTSVLATQSVLKELNKLMMEMEDKK